MKFRNPFFGLLLAAALISGCFYKSTPPGASSIGGSVDGINYSYHYWDEGLQIMIWHDLSYGGEGCSGHGSTDDPVYRLECNVEAQDGRQFSWKVHTTDGISAEMWLNDQRYDLDQGNMFLVSSQDDGLKVEQLQRDFSGLAGNYQSIQDMVISDPDVAAFVEGAGLASSPTPEPVDEPAGEIAGGGLSGALDAFRELGSTVELAGPIDQSFFSVPGQVIRIDGADVQLFEYPDSVQAEREAGLVSPDGGSVGTNMISWIGTPHFYLRDNLIFLFVGEDNMTLEKLSQVLGQPFAEGESIAAESTAEPQEQVTLEPPDEELSFEAAVYRNEAEGYEFSYPADWSLDEQVLGSRADGALFYSSGEPVFSAVLFLWEPHDLDAYREQRKLGWSSSSTVLSEEEVMLNGGTRAFQYEIEGPDGSISHSLLIQVGEKFLELAGFGERELFSEIARTWRPLAPMADETVTDLSAFENQLTGSITSRDFDQLQSLMGDTFVFAFWGSEGYSTSPEEAVSQLQQNYLLQNQAISFDAEPPDLGAVLGPPGILSVWDPARNPVEAVFSSGWGADAQDEAFLVISQSADGSHSWDGIILASGSYGGFAGLYDQ